MYGGSFGLSTTVSMLPLPSNFQFHKKYSYNYMPIFTHVHYKHVQIAGTGYIDTNEDNVCDFVLLVSG